MEGIGHYKGVTLALKKRWDGKLQLLGWYSLSDSKSTASLRATDTVSSFIYREYRDRSNVGYGSMLAMVYLILIIVFVSLLLKLVSSRMQKMT